MRAFLIAFLLLCTPALATQDGWPALHDVTGVASDDVLNIRAEPSAGSEIIGSFAPDATDIEVVRPNERQDWGLVNTAGGTGWVSLAFLERHPGQWDGAFPMLARCFGTEPFWNLAIDGDAATFSTPEMSLDGSVVARLGSPNRRDRHGLRVALPEGRWIEGVISSEACNDGMSDRAYGLAFDALREETVLSGCCSLSR
ncbi:SH3 domain-containing protein [Jannaschia formosa]|uniref:SH3 domain-containing protein n=1 Tax=Jannaschia formosa TaxID=2259592 RepID=UPI000E1B99B0|nr:SH3 domain-containing protein [Jannaschia formosa]TFL17573.1 peptide-binding protein [Jannaschia formosa]